MVSIRAASDIGANTNKVVVTVRDATKTKEREVTGTISVSVMDKPDAPLLSAVSGDPQDGAVNLLSTDEKLPSGARGRLRTAISRR